ncbi:OprO/OprP family phosphate-selective porin [Kordiimonas aquimaris]|uniref:OprO/OprP family phosphate-selective porin n=1 Tax=Kordiimonas aquimaris TaxID=707591 RepID=UPI0021CE046C|nr:porin [Kordiimonas aquimaris]
MNTNLAVSLLSATALFLTGISQAKAQSIEELKAQIAALARRIEELEKNQTTMPIPISEAVPKETVSVANTPIITKAEPGFALGTPDGLFEFNVRGRILTDVASITDENNSTDIRATEFRSARLAVEGKAWKNIGYRLVADFAENEVSIEDAYIEYKTGFGKFRFGHFKSNNSLEEITSLKHITFAERAAFTDAFDFDRHFGIGFITGNDNWMIELGAFKGNADSNAENESEVFAARATYGDELENGKWLLGASTRYRNTKDEAPLRYRQRAHLHLSPSFIATDRVATEDLFYGFESAVQYGSFHAASEVGITDAYNAGADGRDALFYGGYFEAGFFLTGEHQPLDIKKGIWGRPKIINPATDGGIGAWQIAAKFDRIDLTSDGVYGGEQDTYLIGLNWYLNRYTRVTANYSHNEIDKALNVSLNNQDGENSVDTLSLRFQVDW